MWITQTYRCLDSFDVAEVVEKALGLPEQAWHQDEALHQQLTANRPTNSVFVQSISADIFARVLETRALQPADIQRQAGWDALSKDLRPLVKKAISHYSEGGLVTRIQLARMRPGAEIKTHIDKSQMLTAAHRLHIPLTTNEDVVFLIDGERAVMEVGKLYELNNRVEHSVVNAGSENRIHLIIDYLPPEHNQPASVKPRFEMLRKQAEKNASSPPPSVRLDYPLPKIIATSVVRGANQNESHGGIYLIDMQTEQVDQVVDWNTCDISWEGRGWDRGLRGIAQYKEQIYVAASDELFCFDRKFKVLNSWKNPYLRHAHEIFQYKDRLLVTSTGFDSLLSFDLKTQEFDQGWTIRPSKQNLSLALFDPRAQGPEPGNSLHINNVFQDDSGIYISGRGLPRMLRMNGEEMHFSSPIPFGSHNAMPYEQGVLYNDTNADILAYQHPKEFCYLEVPVYDQRLLENTHYGDEKLARQGFGRGLCSYRDDIIIAGSSPSTITAWDLRAVAKIKSVNISMDIRNAIHGLEIWQE